MSVSGAKAKLRLGQPESGTPLPEKPRATANSYKLLSDLTPQRINWLWPSRIPSGELTIIDGDPSTNKSSLTLDIAARVSAGRTMPDGAKGKDGGVLLLQAEDSVRKTLLLRAQSAGANLERIAVIEQAVIPTDLDRIEATIQQVGVRLIVIDPLMCFVALNANWEQAIRQALTPLRELAERYDLAVVMVRHLHKSGGLNALYRGSGSIGITAAVRSGFLVAASPQDPHMRVLCHYKSNLGPLSPSLLFEPASEADGQVRIQWRGECEYSARDLLVPTPSGSTVRAEAKRFLQDILCDGEREQREVLDAAASRGLSRRTLERAKSELRVLSRRKGFGPGSSVHWELPSPEKGVASANTPPTPPLAVYAEDSEGS